MNEKPVKKALQNIAHRRTAHHADIWLRIESQLQAAETRRTRSVKMPVGWAAMLAATCVIMLLFVGAGAYAMRHFSIDLPDFDPGLQQAHDDQFGTEMEASQTIDGVTATIAWAYADQHRIAVFYTVSQPESTYQPVGVTSVVDLRLQDGTSLPRIFGGGGGGGGGGNGSEGGGGGGGGSHSDDEIPQSHTSWTLSGSANFDATSIVGDPAEMKLALEIRLQIEGKPIVQSPDSQSEMSTPLLNTAIGPFQFDFVVPFIPATVIERRVSQYANNVTLTLERISVTPSSTKSTLCMNGLSSDLIWLPEARLDTGQEIVSDTGFIGIAPQFYQSGKQLCVILDFLAPYRGTPESWTLIIDRLHGFSADDPAQREAVEQLTGVWEFSLSVGEE